MQNSKCPDELLPPLSRNRPGKDALPAIESIVAKTFQIDQQTLHSRSKRVLDVWPRQVAQFFMSEFTSCRSEEIAAYYGSFDRSTISYSVNKVNAMMDCYPKLKEALAKIRTEISKEIK